MKYYILTSIFLISTCSIVAMKPESFNQITNSSKYSHLERIKAAASITILNNDTYPFFRVSVGNLQKDGVTHSSAIYKGTQITLCPYLYPNALDTQQIINGTTITLSLYTDRLHCFIPYKSGNSNKGIHKGNFFNTEDYSYVTNKEKCYMIHNKQEITDGIKLTVVEWGKNNTIDYNLQIGGNSPIQFGDTISIDHDKKHKIRIIHNGTTKIKTFRVTDHTLKLSKKF